jgi:rod shape-determining protein MreC
MKTFLKKTGITVLIVLSIVVVLTLASYILGGAGVFTWSVRSVVAPLEKLAANGVAELEKIYGYMYKYDELEKENSKLKKQIADMEEEVRLSAAALKENERLRKLLDLSGQHPDYQYVDASVVSWSSSNWSSSFFIDKGTRSGLSKGDCVVTEEGYVVGLISEADANTATVRTVIDSGTAIGAILQDASITAVAEGDFTLMTEGQLKLKYIFSNSDVLIGDTVLTSGSGGIYPSGLVIGRVSDLKEDSSGFDDYGIISPSADMKSLTQVFIIKYYEAENDG